MAVSKCSLCGTTRGVFEYKRKKYCEDCFIKSFDEQTVNKHFCYLTFQDIFGRKPSDMEWTQMNKMVAKTTESSTVWTWGKIEYALWYVYNIEKVDALEDSGVVGLLPYYEAKMMKYRNSCLDVQDDIEEYGFGIGEEETVIINPKEVKEIFKSKSIDALINWDEDDN